MNKKIDIQGHRGARGHFPENSLAGFAGALRLGAQTLELDVVVSGDGRVVVSHEAWMNEEICSLPDGTPIAPGTGKDHNLFRMPYAEIRQFDCGKRRHPGFPLQQPLAANKPLLKEVIEFVEAFTKENELVPAAYTIELKTEAEEEIFNPAPGVFAGLVLNEIKKHGIESRVQLQSFDVKLLREIRSLTTAGRIGLLIENRATIDENLRMLEFIPNTYSPEYRLVNARLVKEVRKRGMELIPWTVNEKADMQFLISLGVDGIITDYPDRLYELLNT